MFSKIIHSDIRDIPMISVMVSLALVALFVMLEPSISRAVGSQFTVSTSVTAEISFATAASNITMASLPGVTGGTTTGATQVIVTTNNAAGYNMTMISSSSPALQGDTQGDSIPDYTPASAGVPDYNFVVAANRAEFGYTIEASTTSDLDPSFLDNGSSCGVGAADAADRCWINASSTAAETLINTTGPTAASGSTSTIKFQLVINPNPSPAITQDSYTATNTLTAIVN